MINLLILLAMPEAVRNQYRDRLAARFPELNVTLVDHHSKVAPHIATADALVTFAPTASPTRASSTPPIWSTASKSSKAPRSRR